MRKQKLEPRFVLLLCVLCCVITAFLISFVIVERYGGLGMYEEITKYVEVRRTIDEKYIGEADVKTITDAAYAAMIAALDDRWSYYMSAEEHDSYKQYSANQYAGIGISILKDEDTGDMKIVSVNEDSPAQRAGLEPGQILIAIDGESVADMTTAEVSSLIQVAIGRVITVTVLETGGDEADYEVDCEMIFSDPVSFEMLESNVGYVRIKNFESGAAEGFSNAVDNLIEQGASAFVFDVRFNPGGKVTQLLLMLDKLLPEGDLFISRNKAGGETVSVSDAACIGGMPMAVLVNGSSYSAAEFFAAVLSEYDWAEIVGEQTTGKGRSQTTEPVSDGSAVHISSGVYLTPNRVDLSETGGIVPDVVLELDEETRSQLRYGVLPAGEDVQLQAAILSVLR